MPLQTIGRQNLGKIGEASVKLLQTFAEKNNLVIEYGGGTYGELEAVVKLRVRIKQTASGKTPSQIKFEELCGLYGFRPADYGAVFIVNGSPYKICGIGNGWKYAILATNRNGRTYKFPAETVKRALLPLGKVA